MDSKKNLHKVGETFQLRVFLGDFMRSPWTSLKISSCRLRNSYSIPIPTDISLLSQVSCYFHIPYPSTPPDALEVVRLSGREDCMRPYRGCVFVRDWEGVVERRSWGGDVDENVRNLMLF
ncbi:MAG: hypothetical protein WCP36_09900 [Methanomicrobiales archaeon]